MQTEWLASLVPYVPDAHSEVLLCSADESRKPPVRWGDGLRVMMRYARDKRSPGVVDPRYTAHWSTAVAAALLDVWGEAAWPVNDHRLHAGQGALDWPGAESER